jgi:hypothetical protein
MSRRPLTEALLFSQRAQRREGCHVFRESMNWFVKPQAEAEPDSWT